VRRARPVGELRDRLDAIERRLFALSADKEVIDAVCVVDALTSSTVTDFM
jgi:hypothetical protein